MSPSRRGKGHTFSAVGGQSPRQILISVFVMQPMSDHENSSYQILERQIVRDRIPRENMESAKYGGWLLLLVK